MKKINKVKKAGCILVNIKDRTIALVYRKKQNDYSFPKGHVEKNEELVECAIRETAEETKRKAMLLEKEPIYVDQYITSNGEDVTMYYYLAKDIGKSYNDSMDTHETFWIPFDEVYDKLSYSNLKLVWNLIKNKVEDYFL